MISEAFGTLCALFVVLAFVTVIGHGIWVFLSHLFAWVTKSAPDGSSPQPSAQGTACSVCGASQSVVNGRCNRCGASVATAAAEAQRSEYDAIRRRLNQWAARGDITAEQLRSLMQLLNADERTATPAATIDQLLSAAKSRQVSPAPAAKSPTSPAANAPSTKPTVLPPEIASPLKPQITIHPLDEPIYVADVVDSPRAHAPTIAPVATPTIPVAPRRTFADMLQAFMEDSNIRWAEIISGLLIVVSAVGLVISLRATLKERIPYFPALSFLLITAAIHAAGLYSLKRWNLRRTSRGVLIVATLLVPLNFLASIMLTGTGEQQRPVADPIFLVAVVVGLVSFTAMNYFASRALVRHHWWRLMVAVLGTSVGQLLINRLQPVASTAIQATGLLAIPVGAYAVANLTLLHQTARRPRLGALPARQFFLELGICVFALAAPFALYIAKSGSIHHSLAILSPLLSLIAATVLASGLLAQRLMLGEKIATYRTAGTALAVFGGGVMLLMAAFAWPQLELLVAVGAVNFALLTAMAVVARLPLLHVPAVGCLALAYLSAFHLWQGVATDATTASRAILNATFTGRSGVALSIFTTGVAAAAVVLVRRKARASGVYYFLSALGLAVLCIAVASYSGFVAPRSAQGEVAAPILLYLSAAAFVIGAICVRKTVRDLRWLSTYSDALDDSSIPASRVSIAGFSNSIPTYAAWAGSILFLAAAIQALRFNDWVQLQLSAHGWNLSRPILVACLVHTVLMSCICLVLTWRMRRNAGVPLATAPEVDPWTVNEFALPLGWSALATSIAATPFALRVRDEAFGSHALFVLACAITWKCFALVRYPQRSFAVFQALALVAASYAVAAGSARTSWWTGNVLSFTHLYVQGAILAACCAGWSLVRRQTRAQPWIAQVWRDDISTDRVVLMILAIATPALTLVGCWPGIVAEYGATQSTFERAVASVRAEATVPAAWTAGAAIMLGLLIALWERRSLVTLAMIVVASAVFAPLVAWRFEADVAVVSALRWSFSVLLVAWTVPALFFSGRKELASWHDTTGWMKSVPDALRVSSLAIGATAILVLTLAAVMNVAAGNHPGGPLAGSIFARMGAAVSYATPLLVLVGVFFSYAVREARPYYALFASLTFQFAVTLACLLPTLSSGNAIDQLDLAKLLQWNSVGLAAFGAVWMLYRDRIEGTTDPNLRATAGLNAGATAGLPGLPSSAVSGANLFEAQMTLLLVSQLGIAIWIAVMMFINPSGRWAECNVLGNWVSYVGAILSIGCFAWILRQTQWPIIGNGIVLLLLVVVHIAAASAHALNGLSGWWGHHTLSALRAFFAVGAAVLAVVLSRQAGPESLVSSEETDVASDLARFVARWQNVVSAAVLWSTVATALAVLAAIRTSWFDPLRPWWPVGITLTSALVAAVLAIRGRRQGFAYYSTALTGIGASLLWIGLPAMHPLRDGVGLIAVHVIALSMAASIWLLIEVYYQRHDAPGLDTHRSAIPVHRFVRATFVLALLIYFGIMALGVALSRGRLQVSQSELVSIIVSLATVTLLMIGAMWDRRTQSSILGVYIATLAIAVFVADRAAAGQPQRLVVLLSILAAHVACSGWMWSWGTKLAAVGLRLGIPEPIEGLRRTIRWLPSAVTAISAVLIVPCLLVVLNVDHRAMRVTAACLPLLLAAGFAGIAQQHRRDAMQLITMLATGASCILLGWSDTPVGLSEPTLLLRAIRMLMALCALSFVCGVVAVRVLGAENGWRETARRAAAIFGGSAIVSLLLVLGLEVLTFEPGIGAPVDTIQVVAVSAVLVFLVVALISLAVLPGRDPFVLSERGRTIYVYAAQAVAGLLFAHIYLAKPELFSGNLRAYWPYIVVAIAFGGVGVSELFQRLRMPVLAEPFQRSGAFLALVPAIGMWTINSRSDYSLVLFVIGVLYMLLSFSQKSLLAGIIAAIAGNGALWSLLDGTEDLTFSRHPQFWLIPPAVSVLIASQLNRRRLTAAQLAAIRYTAVSVIYLSSAVEMLRIGIGESLWPPVILILLAFAGVIFGIAMQVRAYLYLGAIFILVSLVSMVAHASRRIDQVWPWWAFGFIVGISIFILIGLFESRRAQITQLINRLRQWEK